jgi:hypothetical protein
VRLGEPGVRGDDLVDAVQLAAAAPAQQRGGSVKETVGRFTPAEVLGDQRGHTALAGLVDAVMKEIETPLDAVARPTFAEVSRELARQLGATPMTARFGDAGEETSATEQLRLALGEGGDPLADLALAEIDVEVERGLLGHGHAKIPCDLRRGGLGERERRARHGHHAALTRACAPDCSAASSATTRLV